MSSSIGDELGFWSPSLDDANNGTSVLADLSSSGNDGTIVGATWAADTDSGGTRALSFDGVDDYVDIGNVTELAFEWDNPFAISVWLKASASLGAIFSKMQASSPNRGYDIFVLDSGRIRTHVIDTYTSKAIVQDHSVGFNYFNAWHHIYYQYDGSGTVDGMKVWLDNSYLSNRTPDVNNPDLTTIQTSTTASIGSRNGSGNFCTALIDDLRIFNRPLEVAERTVLSSSRAPDINLGVVPPALFLPMTTGI